LRQRLAGFSLIAGVVASAHGGFPTKGADPYQHWEDIIMNRRSIITMMAVGVICFCASSIAQADETLKFRIVSHVSSAQIDNVGDVEGHVLLVARQEGIAFLQDGSVAGAILTATSDYTNGAGTFVAYWNLTLDDGSTIYWRWNGVANVEGKKTIFPESPVTIISGTGQFAGAKGDGTQKGARVAPIAVGVHLYADVVLNVKK
jgi:hypothetical protein